MAAWALNKANWRAIDATVWHEGMPLPDKRLLPPARRRIWELDFLRGVFILLMVMDHTFFDIGYPFMFGYSWYFSGNAAAVKMVQFCQFYWNHPVRQWVHDIVLWGFFLLCGMSVAFSRNNYLHCAKIGMTAIILTCGSALAESWGVGTDIVVRFGVLHMLTVACLLTSVVYGAVKGSRVAQVATFFGLGLLFYLFNVLYLETHTWPSTPAWLCVIGLKMGDPLLFTPGDSFPLFGYVEGFELISPWLAVPYITRVLWGAALVPLLYPTRRTLMPRLDRAWARPVCFVGRHTLVVVVAHQIAIPLLLALITGWFVTPGDYGIF